MNRKLRGRGRGRALPPARRPVARPTAPARPVDPEARLLGLLHAIGEYAPTEATLQATVREARQALQAIGAELRSLRAERDALRAAEKAKESPAPAPATGGLLETD